MSDPITGDLAEFFVDEITIEPYTGQDVFGDETYGTAATYACRMKGKHKTVRLQTGEEKVSTVQAVLNSVAGATNQDRVTLPARFKPNSPPIMAVEVSTDENGPHHERLMF